MKLELQSIGVWSFIKVAIFINLIVGFFFGIFAAMIFGFASAAMSQLGQLPGSTFPPPEMSFGMMIIIMPVLYSLANAFFGTIAGALIALCYNLIARLVGGLELSLIEIAPPPSHSMPVTSPTSLARQSVPAPSPPPSDPTPQPPTSDDGSAESGPPEEGPHRSDDRQ